MHHRKLLAKCLHHLLANLVHLVHQVHLVHPDHLVTLAMLDLLENQALNRYQDHLDLPAHLDPQVLLVETVLLAILARQLKVNQ